MLPASYHHKVPVVRKGWGRRHGSASSRGSAVLWVPGVSAHDLHIFQGFCGRELMFLFFLSFSLVWPQNSFPVFISAYVCAHVEVRRQPGVVLTQTPPTLVFQMGSLTGLGSLSKAGMGDQKAACLYLPDLGWHYRHVPPIVSPKLSCPFLGSCALCGLRVLPFPSAHPIANGSLLLSI